MDKTKAMLLDSFDESLYNELADKETGMITDENYEKLYSMVELADENDITLPALTKRKVLTKADTQKALGDFFDEDEFAALQNKNGRITREKYTELFNNAIQKVELSDTEDLVEPVLDEDNLLEPALEEDTLLEPELEEDTLLEPALEEDTLLEPALEEDMARDGDLETELEEDTLLETELEEDTLLEPELEDNQLLLEGEPELLRGDFEFVGSSVWDSEKEVFLVTDVAADIIYQLDPKTKEFTTFSEGQNLNANGIFVTQNGLIKLTTPNGLVSGKMNKDNLMEIQELKIDSFLMGEEYLSFNSPSDVVSDNSGFDYFIDPSFNGVMGTTGKNGVYRVDEDGKVTLIGEGGVPNGLALSEEADYLYTIDANDGSLKQYKLDGEDTFEETLLFTLPAGGDGLTLDKESNFYVGTGDNMLRVLDLEGNELQTILLNERPTSVSFGGEDLKNLLITTEHGVYLMESTIGGFELVEETDLEDMARDGDTETELEEEDLLETDLEEKDLLETDLEEEDLLETDLEEDELVLEEDEIELEPELLQSPAGRGKKNKNKNKNSRLLLESSSPMGRGKKIKTKENHYVVQIS
jgi:sugar lactone lactonase YvrE